MDVLLPIWDLWVSYTLCLNFFIFFLDVGCFRMLQLCSTFARVDDLKPIF